MRLHDRKFLIDVAAIQGFNSKNTGLSGFAISLKLWLNRISSSGNVQKTLFNPPRYNFMSGTTSTGGHVLSQVPVNDIPRGQGKNDKYDGNYTVTVSEHTYIGKYVAVVESSVGPKLQLRFGDGRTTVHVVDLCTKTTLNVTSTSPPTNKSS